MELKIKLYEKEGKRCCYIEDGKENGQEYRDISLEQACQKAIAQIKNQRYYEYLLNDDRRNILFYGITFCKKRCKVIVERINM